MTFHVGQRVVCIRDDWRNDHGAEPQDHPRKGRTYTVREVVPLVGWHYLRLNELVLPPPPGFNLEPLWWSLGFRPIIERKTDISVFEKLLDPTTRKLVTEDA